VLPDGSGFDDGVEGAGCGVVQALTPAQNLDGWRSAGAVSALGLTAGLVRSRLRAPYAQMDNLSVCC